MLSRTNLIIRITYEDVVKQTETEYFKTKFSSLTLSIIKAFLFVSSKFSVTDAYVASLGLDRVGAGVKCD